MVLFTVAEQLDHHVGDTTCPACSETYPAPCPCGGLIHAAASDDADLDGNPIVATRCDQCGRSEDALDLV
jgi:hypothetical protein